MAFISHTPNLSSSFIPATPPKLCSNPPNTHPINRRLTFHASVAAPQHIKTAGDRYDLPVSLPHKDPNPNSRAKALEIQRAKYNWKPADDPYPIGDAPMLETLPPEEFPTNTWNVTLGKLTQRIQSNTTAYLSTILPAKIAQALQTLDQAGDQHGYQQVQAFQHALATILQDLQDGTDQFSTTIAKLLVLIVKNPDTIRVIDQTIDDGDAFQKYKNQFVTIDLTHLIADSNQFLRDDIFGWLRLAGPHPMRIKKLQTSLHDFLPGWDKNADSILKGITDFETDSIQEARAEGRIFIMEFPEFESVQPDPTKVGYHVYAPKVLLMVPKVTTARKKLLPIAIQCNRGEPIFTANPVDTDPYTWLAAKFTVQVTDSIVHQLISHLGRTHLLVGMFMVAARRTLAPNHPILKLLQPHFEGTAHINDSATTDLINPQGTIDLLTAPNIHQTQQVAASSITSPDSLFNTWMLKTELANRGVSDSQSPLLHFPYRDDALELWEAIEEWVSIYVHCYYKSESDLEDDFELKAWCKEITTNGKLHGFGNEGGGEITSINYLIEVVTMIIFSASVQHAAVNFPQKEIMQFVPAMPLTGSGPAPTRHTRFESDVDLVSKMFPNRILSLLQLGVAEQLGTFRYTRLGKYPIGYFDGAPRAVQAGLEKFKAELKVIGMRIRQRNETEQDADLPVYNYLDPVNIPQSVNI